MDSIVSLALLDREQRVKYKTDWRFTKTDILQLIDTTGIADELDYEVTDTFIEKHIPCKKSSFWSKR